MRLHSSFFCFANTLVFLFCMSCDLSSFLRAQETDEIIEGLLAYESFLGNHRSYRSAHYRGGRDLRPEVAATSVVKLCDELRCVEMRELLPERFRTERRQHITKVYCAGMPTGFTLRGEPGEWKIASHSSEVDASLVTELSNGIGGPGITSTYCLPTGHKVSDLLKIKGAVKNVSTSEGDPQHVQVDLTFDPSIDINSPHGNSKLTAASILCDSQNHFAILHSVTSVVPQPNEILPNVEAFDWKIQIAYQDAMPENISWQTEPSSTGVVVACGRTIVTDIIQDVRREDFTLTAYGLPELDRANSTATGRLLIGAMVIIAAIGLFFLRRRS
jgi:hypothetical protein